MPSCLMCHHPTTVDGLRHLTVYGYAALKDHTPVVVPAQRTFAVGAPMAGAAWLVDSWSDLFAAYAEVCAAVEGDHGTQAELERLARAQQNLVDEVVELAAMPEDPDYDPRVW